MVGGGVGQTGGTLLVGSDTTTVNAWSSTSSGGTHYDKFTAVASGNLIKGYSTMRAAFSTRECVMIVYDSSGIVYSTSSANSSILQADGTYEFTFSSGSITSGNDYFLGTVCNGTVDRAHDAVSWNSGHETGTYGAFANLTSLTGTNIARGNLKIWVTN